LRVPPERKGIGYKIIFDKLLDLKENLLYTKNNAHLQNRVIGDSGFALPLRRAFLS
jgi:hypothetical protein